MTKKFGLIAAAWAISCGSAFLIGRTSTETSDKTTLAKNPPAPTISSRGNARSDNSRGEAANKTRRSNSREASSPAQIAELEDRVRELKNLSDPIARAEGFLELVRNLGPDEFLAAVAAFREGGIGNEQFGEYRLLLTAWAKVNPVEALDYAKENTGTPYARQTILASWAKTDTEGAVTWARDNFDNEGDDNRANPWMVGVITGIASTDLGRATQLLEELPFSRGRGEALDAIFKEVTASGNDDAKLWIAQLTDPKLKEGAASRLAGRLASEDPKGAADWASTLGPDVMKRSAESIVQQWASNDLEAAELWVNQQSQDIIAASGPSLVENMVQKEGTAAAADWLVDHQGDPAFDDSIRSLVWNSINDEPNVAADWIMQLTSEKDRERTFHRVLRGWMQNDRESALQYIEQNPVPESIRKRASMTE